MSHRDKHRTGRDRAISQVLLGVLGLVVIIVFVCTLQFVVIPKIQAYSAKYQPDEILHPQITGSTDPVIVDMLLQVNESEISRTVSDLQDIPTRAYGTPGNRQAAEYLTRRLTAYPNLTVGYQGGELRNIIATLPGRDPGDGKTIMVGAHYDSISSDPAHAPGVTDNACGVAIVMELARVMSRYPMSHSVKFAFWNAEEGELGEVSAGSASYAAQAKNESLDIVLYLNYDSACYDPENRSVMDIMYNAGSRSFAEELVRANALYGVNASMTYNRFHCADDQRSFWKAGYPAIMTHSESHGFQHTPEDTLDKASLGYAGKNARLGIAVLAHYTGTGTV
jgi:hypothetical protein